MERGRRAQLAQAVPQDRDGGVRARREAAEAQRGAAVHGRVPRDDAGPEQAEGGAAEARAAVQGALPPRPVREITEVGLTLASPCVHVAEFDVSFRSGRFKRVKTIFPLLHKNKNNSTHLVI